MAAVAIEYDVSFEQEVHTLLRDGWRERREPAERISTHGAHENLVFVAAQFLISRQKMAKVANKQYSRFCNSCVLHLRCTIWI